MIHTRTPHASPWVVDTRALGRRPGTCRPLHLRVPADRPIGDEVIAVPVGTEIAVDGLLEAVAEGVLVTATAVTTASGVCARCLDPVTVATSVALRELFAYRESTTAATTGEDEIERLDGELLDLGPLVRDEILLTLPQVPLCAPDCRGLCPGCGVRWEDLEPGHEHEIIDPRWAALAGKLGTNDGDRHHGTRGTESDTEES